LRKAAGPAGESQHRPAPRLVEGVEILACILHPETFPETPAAAVRLAYAFK
jgi:hypothetical protein